MPGRFKAFPAAQGFGIFINGTTHNRDHMVTANTYQMMLVFSSVKFITGLAVIH
jgi:hypothetical protein